MIAVNSWRIRNADIWVRGALINGVVKPCKNLGRREVIRTIRERVFWEASGLISSGLVEKAERLLALKARAGRDHAALMPCSHCPLVMTLQIFLCLSLEALVTLRWPGKLLKTWQLEKLEKLKPCRFHVKSGYSSGKSCRPGSICLWWLQEQPKAPSLAPWVLAKHES